ncbi:sodium/calcium exchanger 3-like isoform X2 [Rhipicephalus microplus]|uniref:sodium/calcium exchanger 3-like isoform X2 n=1 Tax=Rhipicephalus microplus TaxID=6941 RepID=UPI003F6CAFD5
MCIPLAPVPVFPKPEPVVLCHLLFLDDPYYIQEKLAYEKSDLLREHAVEEVPEVELTEAQKIALMGRPRLGDQCRCTVRIKESKEFKNTVDKLFQKANVSLMIGTSSWKEQFIEAITVVADDDEEGGEDGDEVTVRMPSCSDYVMHVFTVFWKLIFAFVPRQVNRTTLNLHSECAR